MKECIKCGKKGTYNELLVPPMVAPERCLLNDWLCHACYDLYFDELKKFNVNFIQPERSKREDGESRCGALNTVETQ